MNYHKKNGFTLIEVLVAINLSFLAVTMAFTFYLFFIRYLATSLNRLNTKQSDITSLNLIQEILDKSDSFILQINYASITIKSVNKFISITKDTISINHLYNIDDFRLNSFKVKPINGEELDWPAGYQNNGFSERTIRFNSNQIRVLSFELKKNEAFMKIIYLSPPISIKNFINISKNNGQDQD